MKPEHAYLIEQAKLKDENLVNSVVIYPGSSTVLIPTPILSPAPKKTLVLDLDETLVSSTSKPCQKYDMVVSVLMSGLPQTFFVKKRPHVDLFIDTVCQWFEVVIFTASVHIYADPVIDKLDPKRRKIKKRLYRPSCIHKGGTIFVKDLSVIGNDLSQILIIDNSPVAYSHNTENAIPISDYIGDADDRCLLELLPFLDILRHTRDVRTVLRQHKPHNRK